jgi:hypothetical protein
MRPNLFGMLSLPLCLHVHSALCDAQVPVDVYWASNSQPQTISVDVDNGRSIADLQMDTANKVHFIGQVGLADNVVTKLFIPGLITAGYSDGAEETVPIKFGPGISVIRMRIFHPAALDCGNETVRTIEQSASDPDLLLKRYITARALYRMGGCGSYQVRRVIKAWFDRSYGLAILRPFFRLDDDARDEAQKILPSYVDNYVQQVNGNNVKILNDVKLDLAKQGEYDAATKINSTLLNALEENPTAGTKQGLTPQQLILDKSFLDSAKAKAVNG